MKEIKLIITSYEHLQSRGIELSKVQKEHLARCHRIMDATIIRSVFVEEPEAPQEQPVQETKKKDKAVPMDSGYWSE